MLYRLRRRIIGNECRRSGNSPFLGGEFGYLICIRSKLAIFIVLSLPLCEKSGPGCTLICFGEDGGSRCLSCQVIGRAPRFSIIDLLTGAYVSI